MKGEKIVIIDYGMGNLGSIKNILKYLGYSSTISTNTSDIEKADKLILAGVGAFDNGMRNLQRLNMLPVLTKKILQAKTPILGICLGMQLMTQKSEEGTLPGLGWIQAETRRFDFPHDMNRLKIPHMGWNMVHARKESVLFQDMCTEPRFYFVHSYHLVCEHSEDVLCTSDYGYSFVSGIEKGNIFGVQFHPEKSHKFGMKLFRNFVECV